MEEPDDLPDLETGGQWHQVSDCVDSGWVDHWINYFWWSDQWDRPESEEVVEYFDLEEYSPCQQKPNKRRLTWRWKWWLWSWLLRIFVQLLHLLRDCWKRGEGLWMLEWSILTVKISWRKLRRFIIRRKWSQSLLALRMLQEMMWSYRGWKSEWKVYRQIDHWPG